MFQDLKIAIVIPAYNESKTIESVVRNIQRAFKKSSYSFEVIVVDDDSRDDTALKAQSQGSYLIQHILNTGSGGATATGLSYAQQNGFDMAATLDADGQHDPADVIKGIEVMLRRHSDLLIGSRLINAEGMSKVKVLGNKGLSFITNLLFGVSVTDSQSGLRIFSKKALDNLKWKTSGYEFASEMLWRAKQQALIINEYPIKAIYTDYSEAKGQNNWNAVNIVKSLVKSRILELFGE